MILPALLLLTVGAQADCIAVESEQIRVRDLARAVEGLSGLDPSLVFGAAPAPGVRRVISSFELQRFAERSGLRLSEAAGVCVEVQVRTLRSAEVLAAVKTAVALRDARVEVVDFSRSPVPEGTLVSDPAGLSLSPSGSAPALWRGWVQSGEHRRTPVWAHVFVRVPKTIVVAAHDIQAGEIIGPEGVRARLGLFPLARDAEPLRTGSVIGKQARSRIHLGQELRPELLASPQIVRKGQAVEVGVLSGSFSLRFRATAETGARAGEMVTLRNPDSGKRFRALATGPGKAQMDLSQEAK